MEGMEGFEGGKGDDFMMAVSSQAQSRALKTL